MLYNGRYILNSILVSRYLSIVGLDVVQKCNKLVL